MQKMVRDKKQGVKNGMKVFIILFYGIFVALLSAYAGACYGERYAFESMKNVMCQNPDAESFSIRPVPKAPQ